MFNSAKSGDNGSVRLSSLRWSIFFAVAVGTSGYTSGILPLGMEVLEALFTIFLKTFSPAYILVGSVVLEKSASESCVNLVQLAFLKLIKVLSSLGIGLISDSRVTMMGRWSEPRLIWVSQEVYEEEEEGEAGHGDVGGGGLAVGGEAGWLIFV